MDTVLWLCPSLPTETLKWLSSLPILMQESFWWWQCSDRYIISLSPHLHTPFSPFSPSLISRTVSVDVKHHVYLLMEGADRVAGQLRGDRECHFSGVTKSGRVWRKVPESDARSVCPQITTFEAKGEPKQIRTEVPLLMMMSWCLMSSDVIWHIRDKLWPMPKHGSVKSTYVRCMRV